MNGPKGYLNSLLDFEGENFQGICKNIKLKLSFYVIKKTKKIITLYFEKYYTNKIVDVH